MTPAQTQLLDNSFIGKKVTRVRLSDGHGHQLLLDLVDDNGKVTEVYISTALLKNPTARPDHLYVNIDGQSL